MAVKSWVLGVGIPVEAAVVAALWKLRTAKTDTYTRLQATVALRLAALDRTAIDALVRVRSKLPVSGFDRSIGPEDLEEAIEEYRQALRDKRRLQRRFRRLLRSSSFLIVGLVVTLPSGLYLSLRGSGIENVSPKFVGLAWVVLCAGVGLAALGLGGHLYYEAKVAVVGINVEEPGGEPGADE